jgi:hypothetical protein
MIASPHIERTGRFAMPGAPLAAQAHHTMIRTPFWLVIKP